MIYNLVLKYQIIKLFMIKLYIQTKTRIDNLKKFLPNKY
jgi:hypothetical protein